MAWERRLNDRGGLGESAATLDCHHYGQGLAGYNWATAGGAMTDVREAVHEEIDRMCKDELLGFVEFLATYPTPDSAARRAASIASKVNADQRDEPKDKASGHE